MTMKFEPTPRYILIDHYKGRPVADTDCYMAGVPANLLTPMKAVRVYAETFLQEFHRPWAETGRYGLADNAIAYHVYRVARDYPVAVSRGGAAAIEAECEYITTIYYPTYPGDDA